MKIAIMGMGVVGRAVAAGARGCSLSTFDKYRTDRTANMLAFDETEMCFVCVPTPTDQCGQDLIEIHACLEGLAKRNYKGVVVMKSTVIPGTMDILKNMYPSLRLVHNPEFLTERNAKQDFIKQPAVLLSGDLSDTLEVDKFYEKILKVPRTFSSPKYLTTEWAKYLHNCALAVKLSYLNEIYALIGSQEIYDRAVEYADLFGNIGTNHAVPGPDGKFGWGGMCFPKDMLAVFALALEKKIQAHTIKGAIDTNRALRPEEMKR